MAASKGTIEVYDLIPTRICGMRQTIMYRLPVETNPQTIRQRKKRARTSQRRNPERKTTKALKLYCGLAQ